MRNTTPGFKTCALVAMSTFLCVSPRAAEWTELLSDPQSNRFCTADATWCASLEINEEDALELTIKRDIWEHPVAIMIDAAQYEPEDIQLWPRIFEAGPDRILVGVELTESTSYSGGGASASWLALYSLAGAVGDFGGQEVLRVPMSSSISIRACFDEEDEQNRLSACHDEYSFGGSLALAERGKGGAGLPDLIYASVATSYPGDVSRSEDSTTAPPLTKADLVEVRNEACSYQRQYRFDAASGFYRPDTPEPDCDAFTMP